jgi:glycosyltransferase involved in cell wall biosynthesis
MKSTASVISSVDDRREWLSVADYRSFAGVKCAVELEACRQNGRLPDDAIPLVAVVRNERVLIEAFLNHYRQLGIGRFLIVDNGSDDGTYELLAEAPDVDLWRTTASYKKAGFGVYWQDGLISKYAANRWVMYADVDEFLVFCGMEKGIGNLTRTLAQRGQSRLFAPLLDVYSETAINQTEIASGQDPLKVCCWFDSDPERYEKMHRGISVKGGVRRRLFFEDYQSSPELAKYPLIFYDDETAFLTSHFPEPRSKNFSTAPNGRLLHAKYNANLGSKIQLALDEGQHWDNSVEYRQYHNKLMKDQSLSPHYSGSAKYTGPDSLVSAGFMLDVSCG